jgi:protein TonB
VLLLPWAGRGSGPVQAPPIEVELIQTSTAGAAAAADAPARQPAPHVQPAPAALPAAAPAARPAPPLPAQQPEAASAARAPATPQAAPPAPATAEINLGNGGQDLADLDSRSDDIVPPRPDSRFRNLPPAYPPEAMRRRQEGTVRLVVHVSTEGTPILVELAGSSGHPSLDKAAVDAVGRWRFRPAMGAAGPLPFDYPLDIHFVGDGR